MSGKRQHEAEVTAARLGNAATKWADKFTTAELDEIGHIIFALDEIAAGNRDGGSS